MREKRGRENIRNASRRNIPFCAVAADGTCFVSREQTGNGPFMTFTYVSDFNASTMYVYKSTHVLPARAR